jgi:nicotinate-nucleotide pyrophosphorylase (carboxylating)
MKYNKLNKDEILPIIKSALEEDIGGGDITTRLLFSRDRRINTAIVARQRGIVAGLDIAALVFKYLDSKVIFKPLLKDGDKVMVGKVLAYVRGSGKKILAAERTALNFLGRLSGIATQTNCFVKRVIPYQVKIMDTRKTTPNLRYLEKYAVRVGGGYNHRFGLDDQVLIKDNHLSVYRISYIVYHKKILEEIIKKIRQKKPKVMKIEIEVRSLREFKEALLARPDIIMLDNFNLKDIKKAVKMKDGIRNTEYKIPELEVSGKVNLNNVRQIAATGVDRISVGCLTHSAKSLDFALEIYG